MPRFSGSSAPRRWPSRPFPVQQRQSHLGCPGRRCPGKGMLSGGDCREAAAICTARDDPMPSRAASAASARSGLVRAMRPRITRHSSSATAAIASITAAEGASCSSRNKVGRDSLRPIRPSAQAASLATTRSGSPSNSASAGMVAGDRRAQRQPPARISGVEAKTRLHWPEDRRPVRRRLRGHHSVPAPAQSDRR